MSIRAAIRLLANPKARHAVLGCVGVTLFLGLWEGIPRTSIVDATYLPPLSENLRALQEEVATAEFWSNLGSTVRGWLLGLGIACVAGIVLGIVIGRNRMLRAMTHTTIEFLRPIPSVALIPLVVVFLGTGASSTLALVIYAAFWQMLIQVIYGVADVDAVVRETAVSYRFSRLRTIRTVVWPTALPYAVTGFRLAATIALVLEISGELIIGSPGLGNRIALAQSSGSVELMYALVAVTGVLGVVVNLSTRAFERRALHWHPSVRTETAS